MVNTLLKIIYPSRCPICLEALKMNEKIHPLCRKKIPKVTGELCLKCGKPVRNQSDAYCKNCQNYHRIYSGGIAWSMYSSRFIRRFLQAVKYEHDFSLLDFPVEDFAEMYEEQVKKWQIDVLIPVPLYKERLNKRGFNQAEEIANRLSLLWNIPVSTSILTRVQSTIAQKDLSISERDENLIQGISAKESAGNYRRAMVIDDIYTTGSTMNACVVALFKCGFEKVYIGVLATSHDEI